MQALRTGLELARASQLTMLRLQLALHKSNRRTAMQALDNLLDIDAEMEGLAATLAGAPADLADAAALSGFIGLQKTAIAAEKHVLTGSDWRSDAKPIAIPAPGDRAGADLPPPQPPLSDDDEVERDNRAGIDVPPQPLPSGDGMESEDRVGSRRWIYALAVAIAVAFIGFGLIAYLWPALPAPLDGVRSRILAFASGTG